MKIYAGGLHIYEIIVVLIELLAIIIVAMIIPCFIKNTKKEYKKLYMKEIIGKFVKIAGSGFEYDAEGTNLSNIKNDYIYSFQDTDVNYSFRTRYIVIAEDYYSGNIDGVNIKMADVVSYKLFTEGRGRTYEKIFFTGNFMTIDMNKKYERFEIRSNKFKLFDKAETLEVDNQKFEKYFKIYAGEDENIKDTITPALIEFLADFREKYGIDFEMFFRDKVYIRFYTDNMFEPKTTRKIVDKYSVYKFYVITKFAKEFVKRFLMEE